MRIFLLLLCITTCVGMMDTISMEALGGLGVDDFLEDEETVLYPLRGEEEKEAFLRLAGVRVVIETDVEVEENVQFFEELAEQLRLHGIVTGLHPVTEPTTTITVHRPTHFLTKSEHPHGPFSTTLPDTNLLSKILTLSHSTVMHRESFETDVTKQGNSIHITALVPPAYTDEKMIQYYVKRLVKGAQSQAQLHLMTDADGEGFMIEMDGKAGVREVKVTADSLSEFIDDAMAGEVEMHSRAEGRGTQGEEDLSFLRAVQHITEEDVTNDTIPPNSLILFYAPWCGHCQALKPVYVSLPSLLLGTNVLAANVDQFSTDPPEPYQVEGFPTIYYKTEAGQVVSYNGDRSEEDIIDFVTAHSEHSEL